jgi:hypothetical protein
MRPPDQIDEGAASDTCYIDLAMQRLVNAGSGVEEKYLLLHVERRDYVHGGKVKDKIIRSD